MMTRFMIGTFADLFLRVILAKILSGFFGTAGIWSAWPVGWIVAAILSLLFFRTGVWNQKQGEKQKNPS